MVATMVTAFVVMVAATVVVVATMVVMVEHRNIPVILVLAK
jgi:hypothetical protein